MARDILSNMETKNNNKETRKEKINRLVQELEKEKDNVNQLRNTIDVMHAGWSLDKAKLSEATERLNEKVIKVQENVIEENKTSLKRRITTRSVSLKKMYKGDGTSTNDLSFRKTSKGLISCPLCCNESFPNEEALKYHLRSVFENVFCPLCSQKCENVTRLISHLEIGCDRVLTCEPYPEMSFDSLFSAKQINIERSSDKTITLPQNTLAIVSIKPPDLQSDQGESLNGLCIVGENIETTTSMAFSDITSNTRPVLPRQTSTEKIEIKQEETDTSASADSDVEEVMKQHSEISLSDDESDRNNDDDDDDSEEESTTNEDEPAESEEYVCSACNMSFTSLIPHIQEYHAGEQVKIMGAPEELRKKLQLTCGKEVTVDKDPDTGPNLQELNSQKNPPNDSLSKSSNEQIEEKNNDVQKGYWAKRGQCYNFVNNEAKMKLLDPSFEPPKTKLNTSLGINTRPRWTKLLDKLELIQIVDDKILLGGASQYHISIYIVDENKARDKKNLGPIAKVIPILHRSKVKISESDDEFDDSTKSEINKSIDESNIQRRCNQYIQVLKVPLGKDKEITIENVNFDFLPPVPENVVPYLDNVTNPEIPLLKGAKQLKWHCELCLTPVTTVFSAVRPHNCYKCKYCEKGFRRNIKVFMQHVLACAKNKANIASPFACSCCPSFFKTIDDARNHMPLHFPGSNAVQCHLCYCLFSDNNVLNKHYKVEHDTDLSQVHSAVRQPRRYKKRNTYKTVKLPKNYSKRSENTNMKYKSRSKNLYKSDDTFPEVEIKEEKEEDLPSRGSRKRKVNKTYFDEYYVY